MFTCAEATLCAAAAAIFSRSASCFASSSRPRWIRPSMACALDASTDRALTLCSRATTSSIFGSPYASSSCVA